MPVLQPAGILPLLAVDGVENYFKSRDPALQWDSDLTFLGNLNDFPAVGILSASSSNLSDMLCGAYFVLDTFPRANDYNTTKIIQHELPLEDPYSLEVARRALG